MPIIAKKPNPQITATVLCKSVDGNFKLAMKARLVWLVLCFIWGSTWLFIKLGLEALPPLTFAGIRFVIACAIILSIIRIRGIQLPRARRDWILLATTGILCIRT